MCNLCANKNPWWLRPHTPGRDCRLCTLYKRSKQTFIRVFASLFAKREWVSGRSPENFNGRKRHLHTLYRRAFEKSGQKL
jgi:hypothetical protein